MLLGQFSVTFEYRPGAQHANADGMSRQCGQCTRPDCPVSSSDSRVTDVDATTVLLDQPFASSEMGDSMDPDLLPELSGETWVAATLLEELTADLPPAGSDLDLIVASRQDATLTTVCEWVQLGAARSVLNGRDCHQNCGVGGWRSGICQWTRREDCGIAGLLRPFHDSLFAGHLGVSRTVYRLLDRVYWPGLRQDLTWHHVQFVWPMGHVDVGRRWDRVAMDLLDMSVTTPKGNRYVLVMVDFFSMDGSLSAA